ncbi:MAG TPA: 30S ribosomal protein S18 [Patescibacteria group bacterium]|nr:30S ribosomal protein S18 [Patescibacteria group bacterium]
MAQVKRNSPPTVIKPRVCYFCINGLSDVDYKDTRILQKFLSGYVKILPRRRTGTCTKHQRKLSLAIKRARFMALIPYVPH